MRYRSGIQGATSVAALVITSLTTLPAYAQVPPTFVNSITLPGNATDLGGGTTPNQNRLSPGSDLYYDRNTGFYYGIPDRGPGGGLISYETRVQKFTLDVNSTTGAIGNFTLVETIKLKDAGGVAFNGLNPQLLNGNNSILGRSFDPEGFSLAPNGNFLISDEYGPSVYEFTPSGNLVRQFTAPSNLIPRDASNNLNFVDGFGTITNGRQDNRGYEGLAVSADGTKVYAMLQDPLVTEGASNDGRRSRNLRIVEYSFATGQSTAQYIYQLEDIASINARIPGTADDFSATAQGRNIGISSIIPLGGTEFLVLERDNRGFGAPELADGNPNTFAPVGSKRLYKINLAGATDVSGISLVGTNNLPNGVSAVQKELFLDIQAALVGAGLPVSEKMEGVTIGPQLNDGSYSLIVSTDNDFSVTQTGSGEQFDVYQDGTQVPIGTQGPANSSLVPTFFFAFKTTLAAAPEPASGALLLLLAPAAFLARRRK